VARPSSLASVPLTVPAGQLVNALSANQVGGSVIRIVGPAAGAAIIGAAGPKPAFFLQAVCFIIGAIALAPLKLPARNEPALSRSIRQDMWEGLHTVRTNAVVRGTAAVEALWQTITALLAVTLVVYVDKTLGYGDHTGEFYGALMATFSLGAAGGAIAASRVEARIGRARLMAFGYFSPLLMIPFALVPPDWMLFVIGFFFFFGDAWAVIAMQAYLAESVPDRLRGRVYAAWNAAVTAGAAIAFLVIGWLTTHLGPERTMAFAGLLVGIGGPLLLYSTGAIDAMREHRPVNETAAAVNEGGE
ncbi:MAG: MFS transporter, partial [Thermomicrobiales bacterium]